MSMTVEYSQQLRDASLRVTAPRLAVLEAVHRHPHAGAEIIIDALRGTHPGVSRQSVYNCLHVLAEAGLIRRIQPAGATARYEARVADNHHHLVCRSCGTIVDVDCAVGEAPCLSAADDAGFAVDEAEVVFWGLCPECSRHRSSQRKESS